MIWYRRPTVVLWLILLTSFICLLIDLPRIPFNLGWRDYRFPGAVGGYQLNLFGNRFHRDLEVKLGLDLAGGVHLVLRTEMAAVEEVDRDRALEAAKAVIERRVNLFGVTEANIYTQKSGEEHRIVVELPGVTEVAEAVDLVGQTAQLSFKELLETPSSEETGADEAAPLQQLFVETDLSGADLRRAGVTFDQTSGKPQVALEFSDEGAEKFKVLTERNVGQPVAIFLDEEILTAPRVQEAIAEGRAVITGEFTVEEAEKLAIQLNAGALPVPIEVIEQRNIGATLGAKSVRQSLTAGLIGLTLVGLFMILYYGKLGLLADLALVVYGLVTLAIYKLIPVVLTLPGLAGFILSIGMAVDSNILVFERIKEELRWGKPHSLALELGFGRAWDSIRDANICTLIICFVLFNPFNWSFLVTAGPIRGFALTLALGIGVSLFTGIVVTRNLVRVFYRKQSLKIKTVNLKKLLRR